MVTFIKKNKMPLPLVPLIAAGASLVGQGINALSTSSANKAQLDYNREAYDKQRRDALADWTMQNEYNSPAAQMQRYKDAGLNPNLIYGQMTNSPAVRTSTAGSYNPEPVKVDLPSIVNSTLSTYYDTQMKKAQISNLQAQNSVILQDALLKSANIAALGTNTEVKKIELSNLQKYSADAARESLRTLELGNQARLQDIDIKEANRGIDLKTKLQNLANMQSTNQEIKQRINNLINSGKISEIDAEMKKNGIQPNDPLYLRVIQQLLQNPKDTWDRTKNWFKSFTK